MARTLRIDAYMDLICPWCLIGKRNLQTALVQLQADDPSLQVTLTWHSVQLLANLPVQGEDFNRFYVARLGSPEAVRARQAQVLQAATLAGVSIDFARIRRMPNTRLPHQLLAFAQHHLSPPQVDSLLESLLCAHFQRGQDISDMDLLRGLAAEHGLDLLMLDQWLQAGRGVPQPIAVPGVPFLVANQASALSGAHSSETLVQWMRESQFAETAL